SFELLTPKKAKTFQDLSFNSLLARHTISYHYSLYMIGNELPVESNDNYIAFVPGFTEEAKKHYQHAIKDSIELDLQYLSLLSQPHTVKIARNLSRLLKGQAYLDNTSTLNTFRKNAAGHKIVHIGTHAEFNNLVPERSRLIFAKDIAAGTDSNSLFLDEIYECNIKSDLAILTACESGKPGFQDGEGMISIAHAFNYAGSNSILTGLWKIDEKASSQITEIFVKNLEKGMSTALVLKKAKLQYLGQAQGRTLAPAYWAGLVLIGQTPALELNDPTSHTIWLFLGGVILLAVLVFYFLQRSRNLKNSDRDR
ncbi:MAG TPA: CHAT domain-containing protein, partial [Chitinophagaceae bacterium]|nr:CHAT domain-containing protein [Chitinophagaceae bacterium]